MVLEVEQRFVALEKLVNAANAKGLDEQQASYLCRLGSVLVCGNLERCIEILVTRRFENSQPQVGSFLKSYFKRGTNYDCQELCELLYRFDPQWGRKLESGITGSIKESISSCYSVRNSVAHGGGNSLGPKILKQYFSASFDLVALLEEAMH